MGSHPHVILYLINEESYNSEQLTACGMVVVLEIDKI